MTGNALYSTDSKGFRRLHERQYELPPIDPNNNEQRFLVLHPCLEDRVNAANYVRCSMEVHNVESVGPFIAVKNSRGYRHMQEPIQIDGMPFLTTIALEVFLRNFRREDQPVVLWIRHICLEEFNEDEKERYWTRNHIDSMYARAIEVVDMATFNDQLLEKRLVRNFCDARYNKWTKEWGNLPDVEVFGIPKVFPVRVGAKFSIDNPTERFAYVPLDLVASEIRLLVIAGSGDPSAPLVTGLAHSPIKDEIAYHALSYTWGPREPTVDIYVNGQLLTITKSLEVILRSLRAEKGQIVIWIDAICIDQANWYERNVNLPRMAEIYHTAAMVVSHLGELKDEVDEAIAFANQIQTPQMQFDEYGWIIGKTPRMEMQTYYRGCAALYKLLTRPYFRRVWILQEVANASNPQIGCGYLSNISLRSLEMAARNLQDMLMRDRTLANGMKSVDPGLGLVSGSQLVFVRKLFYFRHLLSQGQDSIIVFQNFKFKENTPGILETAILARDFKSSDGHDKVFALWNLAQDTRGLDFRMDYTIPVPESFTMFAIAWATQQKSLDIIAASERSPESIKFYDTAPAWCPDWTASSCASCLVRRETIPRDMTGSLNDLDGRLYSADGGLEDNKPEKALFSFHDKKLICTGLIFDVLKTIVFHGQEDSASKILSTFKAAVQEFYSRHDKCPYDDSYLAVYAMSHGDVVSAWGPRTGAQDSYGDDIFDDEPYFCDTSRSRHVPRFADSYSRVDAQRAVKDVVRGRLLAFTEDGYACLVPHWVGQSTETWQIAILAGCSVPVILQALGDGTFRFAGSCFVQGWMEGEIISEMTGADDTRSFWSTIGDAARLCIV
ncbi:Heterokaryon incompatibility protein [Paramyrothecium foliicola]|nr:Heterokaryon incompatibility protein [Paramyrothecium foliicola]